LDILEEGGGAEIYGDDLDKQMSDFMEYCCEVLSMFARTEMFSLIPKTPDFKFFCIDHDEDIEDAEERIELYNGQD